MFTTGTATGHADLLDRLNTFLTAKGSAFGLTYTGTGDGTFTAYSGGASSVAETFTITATSATNFTVVGSVSGSIGPATVGTPFAHATLEFTLTAGATPFVSGDVFELSTAPKWTEHRKTLGCSVLATQGNTGALAAQNVVDGKDETSSQYWQVYTPITLPQDLEFTFYEAETIASYSMASFGTPGRMPEAWTFDYWDGVSSWVTLDSESGHDDWTADLFKTFAVGSPVSATKYRLHITTIQSTFYLNLGAVRLLRSDDVDAAFSQTIWKAPGNDGDSEILVGAHAFERQDADYFDWELAAFDGYAATSRWRDQVGHHSKLYLPLWDGSIPYWFVADGRRVVVVAKLNTQYEVAYLGSYDPYFSPDQWPYPIALGGSLALEEDIPDWDNVAWRWSNTTAGHHAFPFSDPGLESPYYTEDPEAAQLHVRGLSGEWERVEARKNGQGAGNSPGYDVNYLWPACTDYALLDPNLDAGYTVWPLIMNLYSPNTLGQLTGAGIVSGQDLTAETLMRDGAVDWIALPDINRTARDEYLAIRLD